MANLIYDFYTGSDLYSDGDIENEILDAVKNNSSLDELLSADERWAFQYHLNPNRGNLLNVCDISPEDECLEIGAGCGAISVGILSRTEHLDALDLSKRRCMINAERNKAHKDFNIYVGNFNDIVLPKKYDKIFLIGVLEYSKLYFPKEENPFQYMLNKVHALLKDDGILYIAIENKYGMKYFSGATEDHSGKMFQGITGYEGITATTFSHNELKRMILSVGYSETYFYYPLPDYKFPEIIYSEDYLPDGNGINILGHSYDRDRYVMFNETSAMAEAAKSGDFETFANSFLVQCKA